MQIPDWTNRNAQMRKPVEVRFWEKVDKSGDCWEWLAGINSSGYADFRDGKKISGHRFSWTLHFGGIPDGAHVLHKCDNRKCVNPEHLFLGSNADNVADRTNKGRSNKPYGSKNGRAVLTEDDVREIRSSMIKNKTEIARQFGVGRTQVGRILSGEQWGNV